MRRHFCSLALLIAACGYDNVGSDPDASVTPEPLTGEFHTYVHSRWQLPQSVSEARQMAFDLDQDGSDRVDNAFGSVIGTLAGVGLDVDAAGTDAFAAGDLVLLYRVRADDLGFDETASFELLLGHPTDPPAFDGSDAFLVDDLDGRTVGRIQDGVLSGDLRRATARVPLFPGQPAFELPLEHVHVEVSLGDGGCVGILGGALPFEWLRVQLLTQLAEQMTAHMAMHPDHPFTDVARDLFDVDKNGEIAWVELHNHSLVQALIAPDLDMDGDGSNEMFSFGIGLVCVPASF